MKTRLALSALAGSSAAALVVAFVASSDAALGPGGRRMPARAAGVPATACEGARDPLPGALFYTLRSGAFPGSARPDVAVHVPPGFDATRRPGLVVYFHGWQGCVAAALASEDQACPGDEPGDGPEGRPSHPGADLAAQMDQAGVNALLVAIEVRAGMPTGEPGNLAMPAGFRTLLRELFTGPLRDALGCALEVDGLDRVVLVAHSGGYQAAAGALQLGDVPRVSEVVLLDALYGASGVFASWIRDQADRFDPRAARPLRFVDLYTCCGGTAGASRALALEAEGALARAGLSGSAADDDSDSDVAASTLAHGVVFKQVPRAHADLPRAYFRELVEAAGFAHIGAHVDERSHSVRPN